MKLLYDFFPLLIFFIVYHLWGIYFATAALMLASTLQVAYLWIRYRRIEKMHWIAFCVILIFGSVTLLLHDARFLQWKVSVLNWAFGAAFLVTQWIGQKPLVQRMMDNNITLPRVVWKRLNFAWGVFLVLLGFVNAVITLYYSLAVWVHFKVFGLPVLTALFIIGQTLYLYKHIKKQGEKQDA